MPELNPLKRRRYPFDPEVDPYEASHIPGMNLKPIEQSISPVDTGPGSPSSLLGAIPEKSTLPPVPDIIKPSATIKRHITGRVAPTPAPDGRRASAPDVPVRGLQVGMSGIPGIKPSKTGTDRPALGRETYERKPSSRNASLGSRVSPAFTPEVMASLNQSKTGKMAQKIANRSSEIYQQPRTQLLARPGTSQYTPNLPQDQPETGNTYAGAAASTASEAIKKTSPYNPYLPPVAADVAQGLAEGLDSASATLRSATGGVRDWMLRKTGLDKNQMASDLVQSGIEQIVNPLSIPGGGLIGLQDKTSATDAATVNSRLISKIDPSSDNFIGYSGMSNPSNQGGFLSGFKEGLGAGATPSDRLQYDTTAGTLGKVGGNIAGILLPSGAVEKGAAALTQRAMPAASDVAQKIGTKALSGAALGAGAATARKLNPDTYDPNQSALGAIGDIAKESAIMATGNVAPGFGRNWWQRVGLGAGTGAIGTYLQQGNRFLSEARPGETEEQANQRKLQDLINLGVNVAVPGIGGAFDASYTRPRTSATVADATATSVPTQERGITPYQERGISPYQSPTVDVDPVADLQGLMYNDLSTTKMNAIRQPSSYFTQEMPVVKPTDLLSRKFADIEAQSPDIPQTIPAMMGRKNQLQMTGNAPTPRVPMSPERAASVDTQRLVDTLAPHAGKQSWDIRAKDIQDAIDGLEVKLTNGEITPEQYQKDLLDYQGMLETAKKASATAEKAYLGYRDIGQYNARMNELGREYGGGGSKPPEKGTVAPGGTAPSKPIKPAESGTVDTTPPAKTPERSTTEAVKPPEKSTAEASVPIKPSEAIKAEKAYSSFTRELDLEGNEAIKAELENPKTPLTINQQRDFVGKLTEAKEKGVPPTSLMTPAQKARWDSLSPEAQKYALEHTGYTQDFNVQRNIGKGHSTVANATAEGRKAMNEKLLSYKGPEDAVQQLLINKTRSASQNETYDLLRGGGIPSADARMVKNAWYVAKAEKLGIADEIRQAIKNEPGASDKAIGNRYKEQLGGNADKYVNALKLEGDKQGRAEPFKGVTPTPKSSAVPASKPTTPAKAIAETVKPVEPEVKLVDSGPTEAPTPTTKKGKATDVVSVKPKNLASPISTVAALSKPPKEPKATKPSKPKIENVEVEGRGKERATPEQAQQIRDLTTQYNQRMGDALEALKGEELSRQNIKEQEQIASGITKQYHDAVDAAMGRTPKSESPAALLRKQIAENKAKVAESPKPPKTKPAPTPPPPSAPTEGMALKFTDPVNKKEADVKVVRIEKGGRVTVKSDKTGNSFSTDIANLKRMDGGELVYNEASKPSTAPPIAPEKSADLFSRLRKAVLGGSRRSQQGGYMKVDAIAGFPAAKALKKALTNKGIRNEVLPNGTDTKNVRPVFSGSGTVSSGKQTTKEVVIGGRKIGLQPKFAGERGAAQIDLTSIVNGAKEVKRLMKAGATSVSNAISATKEAVFPYVSPAEKTPFSQGILTGLKANKLWKSVARDLFGTGAYIGMKGAQRPIVATMDIVMSRLLSKERAAQGFSITDTILSAKETATKGIPEALKTAFYKRGLSADQLAKLELSETKTGIRPWDWTTNRLQRIRGAVDHINHTYARHRSLLELMWQDAHTNLTKFGSDGKVAGRPSNKEVRAHMKQQMDKYLQYADGNMPETSPDYGTMQSYKTISDQIGNELTFNNENAIATNLNKAKQYLYDKGYDGSKASLATAMLLDYKAPFVRANVNILYQVAKHTPLLGQMIDLAEAGKLPGGSGGLKNKLNAIANSQTGRKLFSQSIANAAAGAFLSYVGWQLAKDKKYTPYFAYDPDNPKGKELAIKVEADKRYEGSIDLGGFNVRLKDLPILGESIMMGGSAYQEYAKQALEGKESKVADALRGAAKQELEIMKGMPYLEAISGIDRLRSGESIPENLLNEASSIPSQFVPNILEAGYTPAARLAGYQQALKREPEKPGIFAKQLESQGYDPTVAAIVGAGKSAYQKFQERIPGYREALQPKLTAYGEDIPLAPVTGMIPGGPQVSNANPVISELDALGMGETKLQRKPGELIGDYNTRLREIGARQRLEQEEMLNSPAYTDPLEEGESLVPLSAINFKRLMLQSARRNARKPVGEEGYYTPDFYEMRRRVLDNFANRELKKAEEE